VQEKARELCKNALPGRKSDMFVKHAKVRELFRANEKVGHAKGRELVLSNLAKIFKHIQLAVQVQCQGGLLVI
jgi:hypothetical protein